MGKRNSLLQHIKKSKQDCEFCDDIIVAEIDIAKTTIYTFVLNFCEATDFLSKQSKRPSNYKKAFEVLYDSEDETHYCEISEDIGKINIKKFVAKCNFLAIAKALEMSKTDKTYKKLLDDYYKWLKS